MGRGVATVVGALALAGLVCLGLVSKGGTPEPWTDFVDESPAPIEKGAKSCVHCPSNRCAKYGFAVSRDDMTMDAVLNGSGLVSCLCDLCHVQCNSGGKSFVDMFPEWTETDLWYKDVQARKGVCVSKDCNAGSVCGGAGPEVQGPYCTFQGCLPMVPQTRLLVIGSSVAAGSVGGYVSWADQLKQALLANDTAYTFENKAVPGSNTEYWLDAHLEDTLATVEPAQVIISLSLANEGLTSAEDAAAAKEIGDRFLYNLAVMANYTRDFTHYHHDRVKEPAVVLGTVYPNNNYTPVQVAELNRVFAEMQELGYPVIDFLSPVDDGQGHWKAGTFHDAGHPNQEGYDLMYSSVDPSWFLGELVPSPYTFGEDMPRLVPIEELLGSPPSSP